MCYFGAGRTQISRLMTFFVQTPSSLPTLQKGKFGTDSSHELVKATVSENLNYINSVHGVYPEADIECTRRAANIAGTQEPIHGPSACQPVTKQAETTPYTELKKEDLRWAVMDSTCVETQTFYLFAESGHIGMAQLIYNNVA